MKIAVIILILGMSGCVMSDQERFIREWEETEWREEEMQV